MALVALAAWLLYLSLAFGYRTYAQIRATGHSGFVGFSKNRSAAERIAGVLFAVALALGFLAPIMGLALSGHLMFAATASSIVTAAVGGALFVVGLGMTLVAQFAMGSSWRIGVDSAEQTELVVGGLFTVVRNPIFSAMALVGVGLYLLFPSWLAAAGLFALALALELQVRCVEEPHLIRTHGEAYLRYARSTGRFVPGMGLLKREGILRRSSR